MTTESSPSCHDAAAAAARASCRSCFGRPEQKQSRVGQRKIGSAQDLHRCAEHALLLWTLYRCRLTACSVFLEAKTVNQTRRRDRWGTFRRIGYNEHDSPVGHLPTCTMALDDAGPMQLCWECGIGMEGIESFLGSCRKGFFCRGSTSRGSVESPTSVAGGIVVARKGLEGVILTCLHTGVARRP